ncbi:MAG: hypothetical protein WBM02_00010 [bacterium]
MNQNAQEKSDWRGKLRSFSDNMFRNYQIVRKRWEISACEKKRSAEIARLGNLVFRLYKKKALTDKEIEPQIQRIEKIEVELTVLEDALRDLIIKADMPRQLTAGAPVEEKPEFERKPIMFRKAEENSSSKQRETKEKEVKKDAPVGQREKKDVTKASVEGKKSTESGSQETTVTPIPRKPGEKEAEKKAKPDTKPIEKKETSQAKPPEPKKKEKPELM